MVIWATTPLCWMVISLSVDELFGNIFLNNAGRVNEDHLTRSSDKNDALEDVF